MPGTDPSVDGIIILSASCQILHISPRAANLIGARGTPSPQLPSPLHMIAEEIREYLSLSVQQGAGLAPDLQRLLRTNRGPLFVRGFGLPDRDGPDFLTVLVVSEQPVALPIEARGERPPP
jgi:hypothetical protein